MSTDTSDNAMYFHIKCVFTHNSEPNVHQYALDYIGHHKLYFLDTSS